MTHHICVRSQHILQLLHCILHCQYIVIIAIYIARTLIDYNIYCKDPETLQYMLQGSWDIAINIDIDIDIWVANCNKITIHFLHSVCGWHFVDSEDSRCENHFSAESSTRRMKESNITECVNRDQ